MLLLSWNVNGIRSAIKKDLKPVIDSKKYDVILIQESKADYVPIELSDSLYHPYVFFARAKKGYSGTMAFSKLEPLSVKYGIEEKKFDDEGRVLTLEFEEFYLVNAYFPNSRRDLSRLDFKGEFNERMLCFLEKLRKSKPVIVCGDFNVAHEDIDIARPKDNANNAGFTTEERAWFTSLIKHGYIDTYRAFVKDGGHYTWWTYRFDAKARNIGWRIDYFVTSNELKDRLTGAGILDKINGSDHVPIYLRLD